MTMQTLPFLGGSDFTDRQELFKRLHALVVAKNIIAFDVPTTSAIPSLFQYSIIKSCLGLIPDVYPKDDSVVMLETLYGDWTQELAVVLDAASYMLSEMEDVEDDD